MPLVVRNAVPSDASRLAELMHEYVVGFYGNPWPSDEKIHGLIQMLFEQRMGIQFVAEQDGDIVGFATLYFTFSTMKAGPIAIMNDLYLLEPYRDTEAETELFLHCQRYSRQNGYAYMSWITAPGNTRAQRFFDKNGAVRREWVNYSIV